MEQIKTIPEATVRYRQKMYELIGDIYKAYNNFALARKPRLSIEQYLDKLAIYCDQSTIFVYNLFQNNIKRIDLECFLKIQCFLEKEARDFEQWKRGQ